VYIYPTHIDVTWCGEHCQPYYHSYRNTATVIINLNWLLSYTILYSLWMEH